jgi:ribosomal protein L27
MQNTGYTSDNTLYNTETTYILFHTHEREGARNDDGQMGIEKVRKEGRHSGRRKMNIKEKEGRKVS